jgi:hypothetical protein
MCRSTEKNGIQIKRLKEAKRTAIELWKAKVPLASTKKAFCCSCVVFSARRQFLDMATVVAGGSYLDLFNQATNSYSNSLVPETSTSCLPYVAVRVTFLTIIQMAIKKVHTCAARSLM